MKSPVLSPLQLVILVVTTWLAASLTGSSAARADDPRRDLQRDPQRSRTAVQTASGTGRKSITHGDVLVLRFKVSPSVDSYEVQLGDLVEVVSWGARANEDLLGLSLGPAPQSGGHQDWLSADLIRHLELRGLDSSKIAWHGPESVRLMRKRDATKETSGNTAVPTKRMTPAFQNDRALVQAEANIMQATREYLWMQTGERTQWRISFQLPRELAVSLSNKRNILSVGGGQEPWIDRQRLVYFIRHEGEECELEMTVQVDLPKTVVVASRAIRRDEVLDESCLAYAPVPERLEEQADQFYDDVTPLIGKQLRRAISTGQPIPQNSVGEANVISSGEFIGVESVAGSVVVKSGAKALSAGAVGDMINIELVPGKTRLLGIVAGPKLVRIHCNSAVHEPLDAAQELSPDPRKKSTVPPAKRSTAPFRTASNPNNLGAVR